MAPFLGDFWALSPTNMTWVCWNFDQRYVFHKTKTVSEQSFKIKCLSGNEAYPKLMVLVHFWAQFTSWKSNILPKIKFFSRNYILWLSNNTSPRSQINHRILIKLIKKPHFLGHFSFTVQCRPHLLLVKFENLVHSFFRNENSTLEINVSHFGVLHWQQWQPPASAPAPKVLAMQLFPSTDCDLDVMQCSPPGVFTVAGEGFSKICTHVSAKTLRGQYGMG